MFKKLTSYSACPVPGSDQLFTTLDGTSASVLLTLLVLLLEILQKPCQSPIISIRSLADTVTLVPSDVVKVRSLRSRLATR